MGRLAIPGAEVRREENCKRGGPVPILCAENNREHILGVCVGLVPHLRRWTSFHNMHPALTHWANFFRALQKAADAKGAPTALHECRPRL